jgi:uncharacterized membrane protein YhdT
VSFSCIASGGLFQYLFGWLMDIGWSGKMIGNVKIYANSDFHLACLIMPIACIAAFIAARFFIKETYCHLRHEQ